MASFLRPSRTVVDEHRNGRIAPISLDAARILAGASSGTGLGLGAM
jgi:hypothetical protein